MWWWLWKKDAAPEKKNLDQSEWPVIYLDPKSPWDSYLCNLKVTMKKLPKGDYELQCTTNIQDGRFDKEFISHFDKAIPVEGPCVCELRGLKPECSYRFRLVDNKTERVVWTSALGTPYVTSKKLYPRKPCHPPPWQRSMFEQLPMPFVFLLAAPMGNGKTALGNAWASSLKGFPEAPMDSCQRDGHVTCNFRLQHLATENTDISVRLLDFWGSADPSTAEYKDRKEGYLKVFEEILKGRLMLDAEDAAETNLLPYVHTEPNQAIVPHCVIIPIACHKVHDIAFCSAIVETLKVVQSANIPYFVVITKCDTLDSVKHNDRDGVATLRSNMEALALINTAATNLGVDPQHVTLNASYTGDNHPARDDYYALNLQVLFEAILRSRDAFLNSLDEQRGKIVELERQKLRPNTDANAVDAEIEERKEQRDVLAANLKKLDALLRKWEMGPPADDVNA